MPLLASPFELNASVASETRAGESPVLANAGSERLVTELITPLAEAELHEERLDVRLAYFPRLVWQSPNALGRTIRPLFLNQASLTLDARPSARTKVTGRAFGSYGEPDYTILPQLISNSQGMLPQGSGQATVPTVLTILTVSADLGIETEVSRRSRLTLSVDVSHFRPFGTSMVSTPPTLTLTPSYLLTEQTTVAATPGAAYRLTPDDDLALTVGTAYSTYSSGTELLFVSPMLTWRARRSAAGDEFRLGLGLTNARELDTGTPIVGLQALSPAGSAEALWHVFTEDQYGLTAELKATVDEFVDPVLRVAYPRGYIAGQMTLILAPDWSMGVQGDFGASLQTSTPATVNGIYPDETAFSVSVPVRHRITGNVIMEFGGRWAERAPAFAVPASDFAFRERQLWAYFMLTASTRAVSDWSGR